MDKLNSVVLKSSGLDKISIADLTVCYYCGNSLDKINAGKCANCKFPQLGTEVEQRKFLNEKRALKIKRDSLVSSGKMVRNMLLVVALVFLISYAQIFAFTGRITDVLEGAIIVGLFGWLGFWAQKNPYKGIQYGIYLYVAIMAMYLIHNYQTFFVGYLWKLICIAALFYGWFVARSTEKMEKDLIAKGIDIYGDK